MVLFFRVDIVFFGEGVALHFIGGMRIIPRSYDPLDQDVGSKKCSNDNDCSDCFSLQFVFAHSRKLMPKYKK